MGVADVFGANIVMSNMYGEGSHFLAGASIAEALVRRGHNVTSLISRAYDQRASDPQFSYMKFAIFEHHNKSMEEVRYTFKRFNTLAFVDPTRQIMELSPFLVNMSKDCRDIVTDESMLMRLKDTDTIVMDITWPCAAVIRRVLERKFHKDIKLVSLNPFTPQGMSIFMFGTSFNPSYQSEMGLGFTDSMTFSQRFLNTLQCVGFYILMKYKSLQNYMQLARDIGLDESRFYAWSYYKEFDLNLLSSDFSTEFSFPLNPNFIPVGGLTARPAKQLSEELEKIMQSSGDDGVILFSLGTYFSEAVTRTKPEIAEMFVTAFDRLPQKVIWQTKDVGNLKLPSNVFTTPWVPQNDLLGHPKTRVFLYHGGNNGFQEACYHGVPLVVFPLQGDQYDIGARVEKRGIGRQLDKMHLTAENIYEALNDVINDPRYARTAKHVSAIMNDQPLSPRDRAAHWIEHVIKYGGEYLRSKGPELSLVQYYMIDVLALYLTLFLIMLIFLFLILRCVLSLLLRIVYGKTKQKKE
ncbi:UDP-glucuronosyltransferase 2B20-like [Diadema antillarum]|uniref:UDP-glucuronosyltransferase 2B20-like n=1 Tax=Diadema antillarum TaxID=105358 RepID=UPI003A8C72C4